MNNWIKMNNTAGDKGQTLINLDSGMVVQSLAYREDDSGCHEQLIEHRTKIWSLHGGDRYLQSDAETFDRIHETIQRNTTIDYYSEINDIHWTHRVSNCFRAHGIEHISDLLHKTEADLLKMRYFGKGCLSEVIRNLADHNLELSE
jgi:DNA-directed RNA polymerase alpha subunit